MERLQEQALYPRLHEVCARQGVATVDPVFVAGWRLAQRLTSWWTLVPHDPMRALVGTPSCVLYHTRKHRHLQTGSGENRSALDEARLFASAPVAENHRALMDKPVHVAVIQVALRVKGPQPGYEQEVRASPLGAAMAQRDADALDETLAPAPTAERGPRL